MRDKAGDQAQQNRGGQRNIALLAKQLEAQVARQFAKAQFVQPWRERTDKHQHQENNNHPANHGLQRMRPVACQETHRLPRRGILSAHGHHLKELAHFVLIDELLHHGSVGQRGVLHALQNTTIE